MPKEKIIQTIKIKFEYISQFLNMEQHGECRIFLLLSVLSVLKILLRF